MRELAIADMSQKAPAGPTDGMPGEVHDHRACCVRVAIGGAAVLAMGHIGAGDCQLLEEVEAVRCARALLRSHTHTLRLRRSADQPTP